MKQNRYAFCHCHSPIGGVVARIAGHRTKTKVIYTAHGFHFYQGAPLVNWLVYYPVEKMLSRWTDVLITINHEDYKLAKKKFKMKKLTYVPGIGIDTQREGLSQKEKEEKRKELGIPQDAFLITNAAELNLCRTIDTLKCHGCDSFPVISVLFIHINHAIPECFSL